MRIKTNTIQILICNKKWFFLYNKIYVCPKEFYVILDSVYLNLLKSLYEES
jgi:hypothetical protein